MHMKRAINGQMYPQIPLLQLAAFPRTITEMKCLKYSLLLYYFIPHEQKTSNCWFKQFLLIKAYHKTITQYFGEHQTSKLVRDAQNDKHNYDVVGRLML